MLQSMETQRVRYDLVTKQEYSDCQCSLCLVTSLSAYLLFCNAPNYKGEGPPLAVIIVNLLGLAKVS